MEPINQVFLKNINVLNEFRLVKEYHVTPEEIIDKAIEYGEDPEGLFYEGDVIVIADTGFLISGTRDLINEIIIEINENLKVLDFKEKFEYLSEIVRHFTSVEEDIVQNEGYWIHTKMVCLNFDYNDLADSLKDEISSGLLFAKKLLRRTLNDLRLILSKHETKNLSNDKATNRLQPSIIKSFQIKNKNRLTEQNLQIVAEKLINSKLVREVNWNQLKDLLNGAIMKDRIDWEKSKQSLHYFILSLTNKPTPQLENGVVIVTQNKWQIACSCFTYRGTELSSKALSHLKKPQARKVMNDIDSIIKELI